MTAHAHKAGAERSNARTVKGRPDPYEVQADAIKALAHPKRLLIIDLLSDGAERNVTQLQDGTGLSQSNLSQNLALLRAAGLVTPRREGNVIWYRMSDARVLKAVALLRGVTQARLDDETFIADRARTKAKENARRAATLALFALATLAIVALVAGATHPAWARGAWGEVPSHVAMMLESQSFATLLRTCGDASASPTMPSMGVPA